MSGMDNKKASYEYQIYIGCSDSQVYDRVVSEDELNWLISQFFERRKLGFSLVNAKGGYRTLDGNFITEDTIIINLIGDYDLDIIKLVKSLSMIMNQERSMVTRNAVRMEYK